MLIEAMAVGTISALAVLSCVSAQQRNKYRKRARDAEESAASYRNLLEAERGRANRLSEQLEATADKLSDAYSRIRALQSDLEEEKEKRSQYFERANLRYAAELKAESERNAALKKLSDCEQNVKRYADINCELNEQIENLTAERDALRAQIEEHRKLVTDPLYAKTAGEFLEGLGAVMNYNIEVAQQAAKGGAVE